MSRPDKRGLVAVVIASQAGPLVAFVGHTYVDESRLRSTFNALRIAVDVLCEHDAKHTPVSIWVQQRPGRWEPS